VGTHFAYTLPDGSSADASNFSGAMTYTGTGSCGAGCSKYFYSLAGTFSGQDSLGRGFSGSTHQAITISSASRGGDSATDTGGATVLQYTGVISQPAILSFVTPLPSTLVNDGSIGTVLVGVEDSSGHVATSSTATIALSLVGPSGFAGVTQSANAVQGIATFPLNSSLAIAGQYTLSASGAGLTPPPTSAITVSPSGGAQPADFALSGNPATLTIANGQSAAVVLALVPAGGFSDTVTFSCSGLPASASCSFNPASVTVDGSNTPLSTQLTVATTTTVAKATTTSGRRTPWSPKGYQFLLGLLSAALWCPGSRNRAKTAWRILGIAVLLVWVMGAVSCGGSGSSSAALPTPVSSSNVVITASASNGVSHSVSIDMTLTK
jgi:hypothetical protein